MWVLAQDDRALQAGVIHLHDAVLTKEFLVDVEEHVQSLAVGVGIPANVVAAGLHLEVGEVEAGHEHLHDVVLHVLTSRAGENLHSCLAVLNVDDGEVARSLHHVRISGDETHHAVVAGIEGAQDGGLVVERHLHLGAVHLLEGEVNVVLNETELALKVGLHGLDELLHALEVGLGQGHHCLGLEGDGVAHVAAMPAHQASLVVNDSQLHQASHQFVGVSAALVNLEAAVSALEALDGDAHGNLAGGGLHLVVFASGGNVDATGAAYYKLAPGLTVEVEEDVALHLSLGQVVGAIHARLLVFSDKALDGTVLEGVVFHHCHDGGDAQAVVGAQCGAFSLNPITVDIWLNGVSLKVVLALGSLLGHHVHVGLHGDALAVLHARGGGLAHNDVAGGVLEGLNAHTLGKVEQVLLNFLYMSRWTGNLRERIEIAPDALRLQFFNLVHDCVFCCVLVNVYWFYCFNATKITILNNITQIKPKKNEKRTKRTAPFFPKLCAKSA